MDSDRISRVPPYSGYFLEIVAFRRQDFHLLWFSFPSNSAMHQFSYSFSGSPTTPIPKNWFGLFPLRSPLLRESIFLSLPPVTKMFQFAGLLSLSLSITTAGFPHSEISGSKRTYCSPKHIVVRHVLHQLLVPRHPPCALINLTTI